MIVSTLQIRSKTRKSVEGQKSFLIKKLFASGLLNQEASKSFWKLFHAKLKASFIQIKILSSNYNKIQYHPDQLTLQKLWKISSITTTNIFNVFNWAIMGESIRYSKQYADFCPHFCYFVYFQIAEPTKKLTIFNDSASVSVCHKLLFDGTAYTHYYIQNKIFVKKNFSTQPTLDVKN